MLPAILISSFSSESVYWASWSRLWAQSARLASSSSCTVCLRTRPRGQSLVAQTAVPLQRSVFLFWLKIKKKKKRFQTSKLRREPVKRATGATPLMTSISFGMFTAVWHYVANGCRAATMRGGVGG